MRKMKLVMVGNGMAGVRTLEELLRIAPELYDITVFGAEPHPNYNRIMLSPVLAGEQTLDEIVLNGWDWYRDHGIAVHARRRRSPRSAGAARDGCCSRFQPRSSWRAIVHARHGFALCLSPERSTP